jgi:hypothetical protein
VSATCGVQIYNIWLLLGILELKGETELAQKMDAIVKRLDALSVGKLVNAANTFLVESCSVYASPMHQAHNCPSMTVFAEMEHVNAFNNFQKPTSGPYSETYAVAQVPSRTHREP